jgi:hypothetical protein
MRLFSIALLAGLWLGQVQAQDQPQVQDQVRQTKSESCSYTIDGRPYEVPAGVKLCWLSPRPYSDYALLQCGPPFQEVIAGVRRGDPRCERYQNRQ